MRIPGSGEISLRDAFDYCGLPIPALTEEQIAIVLRQHYDCVECCVCGDYFRWEDMARSIFDNQHVCHKDSNER